MIKKKAGYYSQQGTETLSPRAHEKLNPVNNYISDLGSRSSSVRPSDEGTAHGRCDQTALVTIVSSPG